MKIWGAHAPRVLVGAPSRRPLDEYERCSVRLPTADANDEGVVGCARGGRAPQMQRPRVIAEVPESQMSQIHAEKQQRGPAIRAPRTGEVFPQWQISQRDSRRKLPVEILVMANPNPDPQVAVQSLGNGAIIPGYAHRPKARVRTQPFQLQRRVGRILQKLFVSGARGLFDSVGKCAINLPEIWRSQRLHGC